MWAGFFDGKFRAALFSLVSVLVGAQFYLERPWLSFDLSSPLDWPWQIQTAFILFFAGWLLPALGGMLLVKWPRFGLLLIETRVLWSLVVLSSLVVLGLLATELLSTSKDDPEDLKSAFSAIEKAVTALITAYVVAVVGETSTSASATASRIAFRKAFKDYSSKFAEGEQEYARQLAQAVFSDEFAPPHKENKDGSSAEGASGWGVEARWIRAKVVAANLVN